jgi:hypothetical protein
MPNYKITKKEVPTFYFIGVTTGKSSILVKVENLHFQKSEI